MNETAKKKILIIEDEKPLSHALELKLSHEGFDVVATNSGAVGLQHLEQGHFDLVLTDLIIPGVDGFKVLETIQEKKMNIPVIVMTNLNQQEDKKRVFALGASSFFVKSNSPISEIVASIKATIFQGVVPSAQTIVQPAQVVTQPSVETPVQSVVQMSPEPITEMNTGISATPASVPTTS
jgi:DNA-binding response OmpR family regulator